ncbi:MAG TPA: hypothetical protein VL944_01080 [Candidatus Acidoferrum sp.]|nr:hypothetical protein [Candidatus Acidoferrum sp.]
MNNRAKKKGQSSFELLITVSFGLIILLPIVVLAFIQISASNSSLASTEAQQAASKLANIATSVGSQGFPARQLVLIQIPPDVQNVYVGTQQNGVGHEVIFTISTSSGVSYVTAYTPINVSGYLGGVTAQGVYLINVSAQNSCPSNPQLACVYIQQS